MNIIAEKLKDVLPGVEITEDFSNKLQALIELAVSEKVEENLKESHEKHEEEINELKSKVASITEEAEKYSEYVINEMTSKVEGYCDYIVEQFIRENESRFVQTEEYNRMAQAFRQIKESFECNFFPLTSEPANVSLLKQIKESKDSYNILFNTHMSLKKKIDEYSKYVDQCNRTSIFEEMTRDLTVIQKEKIQELVEKANFASIDSYKAGIQLVIEDYSKPQKPVKTNQASPVQPESKPEDRMTAYLNRL